MDWHDARSVLAIRLDGIGDLLMTTPALRALRLAVPGRTLTLLASPAGEALARGLPFVDRTIVFRAPWMKHAAEADDCAAMSERLRELAFDAVVVFTVCTQSALPAAMLAQQARIPLRAAFCRENPYALLTDWLPDPDRDLERGVRHEVQRQLDLVAALGAPASYTRLFYPVTAPARRRMHEKAGAAGVRFDRRLVVVHPGATATSRRYPTPLLAAAVRMLSDEARLEIVVAGGSEDRDAIDAVLATAPGVRGVGGTLELEELAALLAAADVVVCNNSAPAHLAAAVGTPVVDLYALTNPQHTPWGVRHRLLYHDVACRNCLRSACPQQHHDCLARVAPEEVVQAVHALLDGEERRAAVEAVTA